MLQMCVICVQRHGSVCHMVLSGQDMCHNFNKLIADDCMCVHSVVLVFCYI